MMLMGGSSELTGIMTRLCSRSSKPRACSRKGDGAPTFGVTVCPLLKIVGFEDVESAPFCVFAEISRKLKFALLLSPSEYISYDRIEMYVLFGEGAADARILLESPSLFGNVRGSLFLLCARYRALLFIKRASELGLKQNDLFLSSCLETMENRRTRRVYLQIFVYCRPG